MLMSETPLAIGWSLSPLKSLNSVGAVAGVSGLNFHTRLWRSGKYTAVTFSVAGWARIGVEGLLNESGRAAKAEVLAGSALGIAATDVPAARVCAACDDEPMTSPLATS